MLHPERRGNDSAPVDTVPLVVDVLLFLPGLIPGIVALAVDFGTGAIYLKKGNRERLLGYQPNPGPLQLRVVDDSGHVSETHHLSPVESAHTHPLVIAPGAESTNDALAVSRLELVTASGVVIPVPLD